MYSIITYYSSILCKLAFVKYISGFSLATIHMYKYNVAKHCAQIGIIVTCVIGNWN